MSVENGMFPGLVLREVEVVVVPGRYAPDLALHLEERVDGWFASVACHLDRGGYDAWSGPYPGRPSAERNGALWGRDMLRARGCGKMVAALNRFFSLPNAKGQPRPLRAWHNQEGIENE